VTKKREKSKRAHPKKKAGQKIIQVSIPRRTPLMIPNWAIALAWFLAAIPAGAVWYYWDKSKFGVLWSIFGTIILAIFAITLHIHNDLTEKEVSAKKPVYFGFLEPSNEQPLDSTVPANAVALYLGENLRILTASKNLNVFTYLDEPFLTMGIDNGKLWISAMISDSQNQTVVKIIKNEFQAFPEHAFNPVQPDSHSLVVRDSIGSEVLRVYFLNPRRILIYGKFILPKSTRVLVSDDGIYAWPSNKGLGYMTIDATNDTSPGLIEFGPWLKK
jgi:hypothetical protein